MEWITKKLEEINKALLEVENSTLTNETKMTVLKVLKEEIKSLELTKKKFDNQDEFVKNGFGK